MSRWGIRGLEMRVERECSISRGGPDCTVEVCMSESKESEEGVTALQQGETPIVRAAKSSEFGEGKL